MVRTRRTFIKAASAIGIVSGLAGCSGDENNGPDDSDLEELKDLSPEEWREEISERAAEELDGDTLEYVATRVSDGYREAFVENDFSGPYEPLTGNIDVVTGSAQDHRTKYSRMMSAEQTGMDVIDTRMDVVHADGVPLGNLTTIPAFEALDDQLRRGDWMGSASVWSFGMLYNPDLIDAPETWDDILELSGDQIAADFTPSPWVIGAALETAGEDYLAEIGDKGIRLDSSGREAGRMAAEGNAALNFLGASTLPYWASRNDLSLELAPSEELHFYSARPLHLSANPDKPWAARLCIDYIMNQDHTAVQAPRGGTMSLDLETATPPEYADYFDGKIWTYDDFDLSVSELESKYRELMNAPVE